MRLCYRLLFVALFASGCASPTPSREAADASPTLAQIAAGQASVVDLTYALNESNPYWPGGTYQPFEFHTIAELATDGVFSGAFSTPEHLGTHLDAPNHFEAGQPAVDELLLRQLVAPMVVVDVEAEAAEDPDFLLQKDQLVEFEALHGRIPPGSVLFLRTGWGRYWTDYDRYKNQDQDGRLHFPGFSAESARFLVTERGVAGIGIDTLSVDPGLSEDFQVHHIFNQAGGYHIENTANLDQVPATGAWVLIAPIKIDGGSGGPARVWAVTPPAQGATQD